MWLIMQTEDDQLLRYLEIKSASPPSSPPGQVWVCCAGYDDIASALNFFIYISFQNLFKVQSHDVVALPCIMTQSKPMVNNAFSYHRLITIKMPAMSAHVLTLFGWWLLGTNQIYIYIYIYTSLSWLYIFLRNDLIILLYYLLNVLS